MNTTNRKWRVSPETANNSSYIMLIRYSQLLLLLIPLLLLLGLHWLVDIPIKTFHIFHILCPISDGRTRDTRDENKGGPISGKGTLGTGWPFHPWVMRLTLHVSVIVGGANGGCWANMIQGEDTMATDGLTKGIMKFNVSFGCPLLDATLSLS